MKKILFVAFLFISSISYAQNISLDNLISYQESSLSEINSDLIAKSWILIKSHHDENIKDEYCNGSVWTISNGVWEYKNRDIYSSLEYEYSYDFLENRDVLFEEIKIVNYITTNRENYLKMNEALVSKGFKKFKDNITQYGIQVSYMNDTLVARLMTYTAEDKTNLFIVSILNKSKYRDN